MIRRTVAFPDSRALFTMYSMLFTGDAIYKEYKFYEHVQNNSGTESNSVNFAEGQMT